MAAKAPSKDKAKRPTKIKHISQAPEAPTPELPTPEPDAFPVAFLIIASDADAVPGKLNLTLRSLPENAQVCILLNREGGDGEDTITPIDVADYGTRTVRSRTWTYPKGQFSFAKARNLAHSLATKAWGFWIDCDELLCHAQHDGIAHAVYSHGGGVGGFNCGQASMTRYPQIVGGGDIEYINVKQLRLYRLDCGFAWEGYAHEQISHTVRGGSYAIIDTSITVVHQGYSYDNDQLKAKVKRNAALIGRWLNDHPTHDLRAYYDDVYVRELITIQQLER